MHVIGTKVPVRTQAKLQAAATEHMAFIDANPSACGPIFPDPHVKYGA